MLYPKFSLHTPNEKMDLSLTQAIDQLGYEFENGVKWWNYLAMSRNRSVSIALIRSVKKSRWDWKLLTWNSGFTWETIANNPDLPWKHSEFARNPNLTWDVIANNRTIKWNWKWVSANPGIKWIDVLRNPNEPWNYAHLSENPNVTLEIVKANPTKAWNHSRLCKNPSITWEMIESGLGPRQRKSSKANRKSFSSNPNLTWKIVKSVGFHNKGWNYEEISYNKTIKWTRADLRELRTVARGGSWIYGIHSNPSIKEPINKDYRSFSSNPNLTWNFVKDNPNLRWDWNLLASNDMGRQDAILVRYSLINCWSKSNSFEKTTLGSVSPDVLRCIAQYV